MMQRAAAQQQQFGHGQIQNQGSANAADHMQMANRMAAAGINASHGQHQGMHNNAMGQVRDGQSYHPNMQGINHQNLMRNTPGQPQLSEQQRAQLLKNQQALKDQQQMALQQ